MQGIICSQRLNRDVSELFSSNFNCTASHLSVIQTGDSLNDPGSITLENKVFEGPYRGGRFSFCLNIPSNYPFRAVEVWANQPIWHPNIDVRTGKVAVPLDWSPVLTLHSFALAVQMLMLEPSAENAMNLDALSLYISNPQQFDQQVQCSLHGGVFYNITFPCVLMSFQDLNASACLQPTAVKRSRETPSSTHYDEDYDMEINNSQEDVYPQQKRVCRAMSRYRDAQMTSTDEEDNLLRQNDTPSESPLFGDPNINHAKYQRKGLGMGSSRVHSPSPQPVNIGNLNLSTVAANPLTLSPRSQQLYFQQYPPNQQAFLASNSINSYSQKRSRQVLDTNTKTAAEPGIASQCSKLSLSTSPNKKPAVATNSFVTQDQYGNSSFQKFQR